MHFTAALALSLAALGAACSQKTPPTNGEASGQPTAPQGAAAMPSPETTSDKKSAPRANRQPTQEGAAQSGAAQKSPAQDAPVTPQKKHYVVAALGDSITDARSGGGGYLRVLRDACPKSRFENFGKGGDMTNQMRRRFERDILPFVGQRGITTLIVYGGVNDLYSNLTAGRTNDRIESDLSSIYRQAKDAGLEVIAITVSPWGGFSRYFNAERSQNTRLLNSWILGSIAEDRIDRVVDSYPLLSCGDPEVLCPDYETKGHDGLHPGKKGQELLGQRLLEEAFADCE